MHFLYYIILFLFYMHIHFKPNQSIKMILNAIIRYNSNPFIYLNSYVLCINIPVRPKICI